MAAHTISFSKSASLLAHTEGPTSASSNMNPKLQTSSSKFFICLKTLQYKPTMVNVLNLQQGYIS